MKKIKKEDEITECMICGSKDLRIYETSNYIVHICNKCGTEMFQKKE